MSSDNLVIGGDVHKCHWYLRFPFRVSETDLVFTKLVPFVHGGEIIHQRSKLASKVCLCKDDIHKLDASATFDPMSLDISCS